MAVVRSHFCRLGLAACAYLALALPALAGSLASPRGLAVDSSGNVYAANAGNNTVTAYSRTYALVAVVSAGVNLPTSVAVTADGIYVTNYLGNNVTVYDRAYNPQPAHTISDPMLSYPRAALADDSGDLWVLDQSGAIHCYIAMRQATPVSFGYPGTTAMALAHGSMVTFQSVRYRASPAGQLLAYDLNASVLDGYGDRLPQSLIEYAASDADGNVHFTDPVARQVVTFDPASGAQIDFIHLTYAPEGIAVDSINKRLFVGDVSGNKIYVYDLAPPHQLLHVIR